MSDGKLAPDEMLLAVKAPDGKPGTKLNVSSPDGRIFEVIVPPDSAPGSVINVIEEAASTIRRGFARRNLRIQYKWSDRQGGEPENMVLICV